MGAGYAVKSWGGERRQQVPAQEATELLPSVGFNSKLPTRHSTLLQSAHQPRQKAPGNYTIRLIHKLPASVYFCCQSRCLLENKGSQHPACRTLSLLYPFLLRGALLVMPCSRNLSLTSHLAQVPSAALKPIFTHGAPSTLAATAWSKGQRRHINVYYWLMKVVD